MWRGANAVGSWLGVGIGEGGWSIEWLVCGAWRMGGWRRSRPCGWRRRRAERGQHFVSIYAVVAVSAPAVLVELADLLVFVVDVKEMARCAVWTGTAFEVHALLARVRMRIGAPMAEVCGARVTFPARPLGQRRLGRRHRAVHGLRHRGQIDRGESGLLRGGGATGTLSCQATRVRCTVARRRGRSRG